MRVGAGSVEYFHISSSEVLYQLAVHFARRNFLDADGVAEGLGHFLHAVEAFKDRRHQDDLGRLTGVALQVTATHQVELLVGATEFYVALQHDRSRSPAPSDKEARAC